MTTAEFSSELDVIYENINKGGAPGLDEYEKSVILTHAQEMFVKTITAETSADRFPSLIDVTTSTTPTTNGFDASSYVFDGPVNWLKILNESMTDGTDIYTVMAISHQEFQQKRTKAYRYPGRRKAWRLPLDEGGDQSVEIYPRSGVTPTEYKVRFVRRPLPIILTDLSALTPPETIDGLTAVTESEIDVSMHRDILKIAATLAEQYYMDKYGTDGNK